MILPSPFGWISAKQSPPIPVDCGSITPSSAHAATAASAAVPPARMTSIAVSAASGCEVATIAFCAWTVDRPARWKFLMPNCSLYRRLLHSRHDQARAYGGVTRVYLAHSGQGGQCLGAHEMPSPRRPGAGPDGIVSVDCIPARLIHHRDALSGR